MRLPPPAEPAASDPCSTFRSTLLQFDSADRRAPKIVRRRCDGFGWSGPSSSTRPCRERRIGTAMSRGRQRNDLYLAADTGRDDVAHAPRSPDATAARVAATDTSAHTQLSTHTGGLRRYPQPAPDTHTRRGSSGPP